MAASGRRRPFALSFALSFGLTWMVSNRAYPMPWLRAFRRGLGATGGVLKGHARMQDAATMPALTRTA